MSALPIVEGGKLDRANKLAITCQQVLLLILGNRALPEPIPYSVEIVAAAL